MRFLLRAEAGFIVGDILVEPEVDGNPQPFVFRQYVPDGREALTVGFSDRYSLALWAAGTRATPAQASAAWHEILRGLHRNQAPLRPVPPLDATPRSRMRSGSAAVGRGQVASAIAGSRSRRNSSTWRSLACTVVATAPVPA